MVEEVVVEEEEEEVLVVVVVVVSRWTCLPLATQRSRSS